MSHTILLIQPTAKAESRTYSDYETKDECMEGVCKIFEEYLKKSNPSTPSITYDISQLFDYIDNLADLSCLVYHSYFDLLTLHTYPGWDGNARRKIRIKTLKETNLGMAQALFEPVLKQTTK